MASDLIGGTKQALGKAGASFLSALSIGVWIFIITFLISIVAGAILWYIYNKKVYKKKIVVFENNGEGYVPTFRDVARVVKLGKGGEEVLYLKKKKVFRTAYGRQMGKDTYWFAVGPDGYWYNVILGDLDAKMGMLDIEPIERDMRYAYVELNRSLRDEYEKKNFMEKYGLITMTAIVMIIFLVGAFFLLHKIGTIAKQQSQMNIEAVRSTEKVNKATASILQKLDNMISKLNLKPLPPPPPLNLSR